MAPKDFAKQVKLTPIISSIEPELFSATGKKLRVYGERLVPFLVRTVDGRLLTIVVRFVSTDVRRPFAGRECVDGSGL